MKLSKYLILSLSLSALVLVSCQNKPTPKTEPKQNWQKESEAKNNDGTPKSESNAEVFVQVDLKTGQGAAQVANTRSWSKPVGPNHEGRYELIARSKDGKIITSQKFDQTDAVDVVVEPTNHIQQVSIPLSDPSEVTQIDRIEIKDTDLDITIGTIEKSEIEFVKTPVANEDFEIEILNGQTLVGDNRPPSAKQLTLVLVPSHYNSKAEFIEDTETIVNAMLETEPYYSYLHYFQIVRVWNKNAPIELCKAAECQAKQSSYDVKYEKQARELLKNLGIHADFISSLVHMQNKNIDIPADSIKVKETSYAFLGGSDSVLLLHVDTNGQAEVPWHTYNVFLHEFGHNMGLVDEYAPYVPQVFSKPSPNCFKSNMMADSHRSILSQRDLIEGCDGSTNLFRASYSSAMSNRYAKVAHYNTPSMLQIVSRLNSKLGIVRNNIADTQPPTNLKINAVATKTDNTIVIDGLVSEDNIKTAYIQIWKENTFLRTVDPSIPNILTANDLQQDGTYHFAAFDLAGNVKHFNFKKESLVDTDITGVFSATTEGNVIHYKYQVHSPFDIERYKVTTIGLSMGKSNSDNMGKDITIEGNANIFPGVTNYTFNFIITDKVPRVITKEFNYSINKP